MHNFDCVTRTRKDAEKRPVTKGWSVQAKISSRLSVTVQSYIWLRQEHLYRILNMLDAGAVL